MQLVEPVVEVYVPAGHFVQVVDDVAPIALEYVPAGQLVHEPCPVKL